MTLQCTNCGSGALRITSQTYGEASAYEGYQCEDCGATGALRFEPGGSAVKSGCVGSDIR